MNSDPEIPPRLLGLMRAYIDGELELGPFIDEVLPFWRDEGWGPYFDRARLDPEQSKRAMAFEQRFAELTQVEVNQRAGRMRFGLARMCQLIRWVTLALLALPLAFLIGAVVGAPLLGAPGLLVALIYLWVWVRFRPTAFVVHPHALEIIWPLKRRELRRDQITAVRLVDRQELRRDVGWGMRVGAGGLWGGFGWLWTARRGIVQMYVSRLDRFVWIECGGERPWLITPDRPETFVRALAEGGS